MPFRRLNGITIPDVPGSVKASTRPFGPRERMHVGNIRDGKRGFVNVYPGETKPLTHDRAKLIRKIVEGRGHVWSFDEDLFSSRGVGPSTSPSVTLSTTGGKFDGHITVGSGTSLVYDLPTLYSEWSVYFYHQPEGQGSWDFWVHNSNGYQRKNDALPGGGDVESLIVVSEVNGVTQVQIEGNDDVATPTNALYDSIVLLPFVLTAQDFTDIYNWDKAPGNLPSLKMDGDILGTDEEIVRLVGNVGRDYVPFGDVSGGWQNNGQALSYTLEGYGVEVDE